MELHFLGGAREVGRSAVLVDGQLLLDFGMAAESPPQYPLGTGAGGSTVGGGGSSMGGGAGGGLDGGLAPDAVVATHGHLDHVGALPSLLAGDRRPPVHWTPPTRELALTLARDTLKLHGDSPRCPFTREHVARLTQVSVPHDYGEPFAVECGGDGGEGGGRGGGGGGGSGSDGITYEITLFDAGHIPGSAHALVDDGETRLLYTSDFSTVDQRLVAPSTARPDADVVLCESTYSDVVHEERATIEERFVEFVRTTLWEGGSVVVPAFAIGRTQEMMLVCEAHDVQPFVDGMGVDVTRTLRAHPEFLRDPEAYRRAVGNARFVDGRDGQRRRIADDGNVIVTTAGMLTGGPAMTYVPAIADHPGNAIAFSGYQVEGTPGRDLLDTGSAEIDGRRMPVSARVEHFDFSAHADREGLLSFLDGYSDARVLVNHGDRCGAFAGELREDGFDASAPERGDRVIVGAGG